MVWDEEAVRGSTDEGGYGGRCEGGFQKGEDSGRRGENEKSS